MSGKPAARQGDLTKKGGPIVQGSATVLIGSAGGVACSECPGGMAVGNPVNPSLGAKVLTGADELDFALPGPMPLAWQRVYSSYVNAEHGAACGLLGYGWKLPLELRVVLQDQRAVLFDASGRAITFDETLEPGQALYSSSENLWLMRGGGMVVADTSSAPAIPTELQPWAQQPRWSHVPAVLRANPDCVIAAPGSAGAGATAWVFLPAQTAAPGTPAGSAPDHVLHALIDRFGRSQCYQWGEEGLQRGRVVGITDGSGRRYVLRYERIASGASASPSAKPKAPHPSLQPDDGVRLVAVDCTFNPLDPGLIPDTAPRPQPLVRYRYDGAGNLAEVLGQDGTVLRRFSYDAWHRMTEHQVRQGPRHRYVYEDQTAQGRRKGLPARSGARVAEQHNEEGLSYFFDYGHSPITAGNGPAALVRSSTVVHDSLGRTTTYHFEGEGGLKRLVRLVAPDGAEHSYSYDSAGRRLSATDALGRTTWWRYDGAGRLLGVQSPDGRSTQQRWGAAGSAQDGLLLASQDAAGLRTHYRYDDWGRLVEVAILPEGGTDEAATLQGLITRFEYAQPQQDAGTGAVTFPPHALAWCDQPVAVIDAQGGRSQYAYNACGQITQHTDCSGHSQTWRHGAWGEVVEAVDALGQRTRLHHAMQQGALRLMGVQHPGNTAVRYRWNETGRMAAITHGTHDVLEGTGELAGTSATIAYRHDLWGRVVEQVQAGRGVQLRYDVAGRLQELVNENGDVTRFVHDAADYNACGQLARHTDCSGRSQSWRHGAWGEVVEATDALGQRTHYYHALEHGALRLVGAQQPGNTGVRYRWGPDGWLAAATYGTHDVLEGTGEPAGPSTTVAYRHDLWGRVVEQSQAGRGVQLRYDVSGRLQELVNENGDVTRFVHDAADRLVQEVGFDGRSQVYGYDAAGQLTHTGDGHGEGHHPGAVARPELGAVVRTRLHYDLGGRLVARVAVRLPAPSALARAGGAGVGDGAAGDAPDNPTAEPHAVLQIQRFEHTSAGALQRTRTWEAELPHGIEPMAVPAALSSDSSRPGAAIGRPIPFAERWLALDTQVLLGLLDRPGDLVHAPLAAALQARRLQPETRVAMALDAFGRVCGETQTLYRKPQAPHPQASLGAGEPPVEFEHTITHTLGPLSQRTATQAQGLGTLQWLAYGSGHVHGLLLDGEPLLHIERDGLHRPVALDFGGSQTCWRRDALSRLQALSVHGTAAGGVPRPSAGHPGLPALARQHHYDAAGRLARIDTPQGAIHHAYDTAGRLAAAHLPGREPLHYRYDPAGNPWQPAADAAGGPQGDWAGEVRRHLHDPAFDLLRQDGAAPPGHARDRWPDNRVMAHGPWRYRWDACGNLVEKTHADGRQTHRLHWDHAQRLVAHEQIDHATGERVRRIHHYDVFSRRIASRIERSQGSGPQQQQQPTATVTERCHGWQGDALTLTELRDPLRPQDAQRIHTLYHPGTFVPLLRIQTGACAEPPTLAQLLGAAEPGDREQPAPLQALQEELLHGASDHTRRHLHNMGWDAERLQRQLRGEGATITHLHLYHCDHLGTPLALIDAQGRIDWQIELDPWGNTVKEHNPLGLHQPIRMQGQHDEGDGAGLFYNRHRYYDPGMGRYVSQDPIGLAGKRGSGGSAGASAVGVPATAGWGMETLQKGNRGGRRAGRPARAGGGGQRLADREGGGVSKGAGARGWGARTRPPPGGAATAGMSRPCRARRCRHRPACRARTRWRARPAAAGRRDNPCPRAVHGRRAGLACPRRSAGDPARCIPPSRSFRSGRPARCSMQA
nr:DUF6531 domain-containing protein [Paracidovorax oryzae]